MGQALLREKLVRSRSLLKLLPPERPGTHCVSMEGTGQPDCPQFFAGLRALEGVAQVLRSALVRSGRAGEEIGAIQKCWTYKHEEDLWRWRLQAAVPVSITVSAVELAKHLVGCGPNEPITLEHASYG